MRRIGEQRRGGRDRAAQREQSVRAHRARQQVDADQVDQNEDRLADEPKRQRASDGDLRWKGQIGVRGHGGAEFGHVPVGADREQQVEQERDRDQAHRLDEPKSAKAADERQDRTAGVDDQRDRRAGRIEPKDVRPRARQLPEAERVIAIKGEDRERRGVDGDQRRGIWALGSRPAQKRQRRRRRRSRRRSVAAARPPRRRRARAAPSRRATKALRARRAKGRAKAGVVSMPSALPDSARVFLADCSLSRKPAFNAACRPPHSRPIWRLCALRRL